MISTHSLSGILIILAVILTAGCGGGTSSNNATIDGPVGLTQDYAVAYVRRPIPETDTFDVRRVTDFTPGANLIYRDLASPSAAERNITATTLGSLGDVKDVETAFDGSKLIFSMRLPDIEDADPEDQPTWNIWEYDISLASLQRIIPTNITAEAGHDIAPHYLPDGRILFSSSRQQTSKGILLDDGKPQFSAENESLTEPAVVLHVMNADGSDIHQVSFNQSHDLDPIVLDNGKVVFSRWDNTGSVNAIHLYQMNPDGTELQLLYGANSHETGTEEATVQFLQPREMQDGKLLALIKPFTDNWLGGDMLAIDTINFVDNTQPLQTAAGIQTGPAQISLSNGEVHTDDSPSPAGRFSSVYPLWDNSNRALVSWSACRLNIQGTILPCTESNLTNPDAIEARPIYGIFLYDFSAGTQLPLLIPEEGIMYSDVAAAQTRPLPLFIPDKLPGAGLDLSLATLASGVLNIGSVYDIDGVFDDLGSTTTSLGQMLDPAQTPVNQRPARFLRVTKAVGIPDNETLDLSATAFGIGANVMRETVAYAAIEPDGSVRVQVPANVPLSISIVDQEGQRIGRRHDNWLQVKPGETLQCNGCHDASSELSHGRVDSFVKLNSGAPLDGYNFPNTTPTLFANLGETMAETHTRSITNDLIPSADILYTDIWNDPAQPGLKGNDIALRYADLATASPANAACEPWTAGCRMIINYETHIHPLWSRDRLANTCTNCHTTAANSRLPDAQLDLTDGASDQEADHFKAYRELLVDDNEQELAGGILQDKLVAGFDDTGNPIQVPVTVAPPMRINSARNSSRFFDLFRAGGSHTGRLDPAELRLLSEWLDLGGQYYNNPFDAP
ncbi:MAG: hypothetical protein V3W04_02620 [Gammaproteobacteria bacterium]